MEKLQQIINYKFNNINLLEEALTHKSFSVNNNERMEFLGDSILGFIIANYLFNIFDDIDEGRLTRLKSNLVKGETLSKIALELRLNKLLKLGKGELKDKTPNGGRNNKATLENAVEALFGAIFLDSDFITTQQVILNIYKKRLSNLNSNTDFKDNKSKLQEFLQKQKLNLPIYKLLQAKGKDHKAIFVVEAIIKDYEIKVIQEGRSIKIAEQNCAGLLLKELNKL